jgi:phage terminase large subunit
MTIDFSPTVKQYELFKAAENPNIKEILYGGSAGGGKSYAIWMLSLWYALKYPNITIGYARSTLKQIKASLATFQEISTKFNLSSIYKINQTDSKIVFKNGSIIKFFELSYKPSEDPNYDRFGGELICFGVIEEAAGVNDYGKQAFRSRCGRQSIYEHLAVSNKLFITTNPGLNFVYSDFYIPYINDTLPEYRLFIPANINDNPFIPQGYAETLKQTLNDKLAKRLLEGNWDFSGDDLNLFKYNDIDNLFIENKIANQGTHISADIAFETDKCVILVWNNLTVIDIVIDINKEPDLLIKNLMNKYNIEEHNVIFDADGVGQYLKGKLKRAIPFNNNGSALYRQNFRNIKAQCFNKLSEKITEINIYNSKYNDNIKQELMLIKWMPLDNKDTAIQLEPKFKVKQMLGRSPDFADALMLRMYFELKNKIKPF